MMSQGSGHGSDGSGETGPEGFFGTLPGFDLSLLLAASAELGARCPDASGPAVHKEVPAMRPYEVMIIFDADLEEETIRAAVGRYVQVIESRGAQPGHTDYWGKRRFAYELNHRMEGYYVVLQARAEPAAMEELHRVMSLADEVIRHKVLRIPEEVYGPPRAASAEAAG
jgi:small subunit ribosomal protein S6